MSQAGIAGMPAGATTGSIGVQSFIAANQPNLTGDGTAFTVVWDNTTWQVGGNNMDNSTGIFTVPSDGKYLVAYALTFDGLSAAHTFAQFNIETSAGAATKQLFNPGVARTSDNHYHVNDFTIIDATAGLTIYVSGAVGNGAKTVGLSGEFFGLFGYIEIMKMCN